MLVPVIYPTFDQVVRKFFEADSREEYVSSPSSNVVEKDDAFEIAIALPGVKKEDIQVQTTKDRLRVYSKSKEETKEDNPNWACCEFNYQQFSREFTLPKTASKEGLTAKHENGVLTIHIPKLPETVEEEPKQIAIG